MDRKVLFAHFIVFSLEAKSPRANKFNFFTVSVLNEDPSYSTLISQKNN
jgi:hypothetical protein